MYGNIPNIPDRSSFINEVPWLPQIVINETKPFISIYVALKFYHPTCIVLGMALSVEYKSVH